MSTFVGWCYFMRHGFLPARIFFPLSARPITMRVRKTRGLGRHRCRILALAVLGATRTQFAKPVLLTWNTLGLIDIILLSSARSGLA